MRHYLKQRRASLGYAINGIRLACLTQAHARLHAIAATLVVIAGLALDVSAVEWCLLLLAIAVVWVSEAINTAIELVVNLASPAYHPLAGQAKDVAAGAVLLAAGLAAIIGVIILGPKLLAVLAA